MSRKEEPKSARINRWFQENSGPEGMTKEDILKGVYSFAGPYAVRRWINIYTANGFLIRKRRGNTVTFVRRTAL